MKQYPKYKEIRIDWLKKIPEHWKTTKLKYLAEIKGRIGWRGLTTQDYVNDGVIFLGVRNILQNGKLSLEKITRIPIEKYDESPEIKIKIGDVLLAKTGATIGKSCVVEELDEAMTVNAAVNIFRPFQKVDSKFFNFLISSDFFQEEFCANTSENARGNLFQRDIKEIEAIEPPLPEQQAIANFLDNKTAQIDKLTKQKQKLIDLLQEERIAIINQAVTKGINLNVKMKDSGIGWIGEMPAHWEIKKIKYITERIETGITPPTNERIYYDNGDFNWFTPVDFNETLQLVESKKKITTQSIEDGYAKIFKPFSVLLIGIGATLGKVGIITDSASANQQINSITFKNNINPFYGLYYLYSISQMIVSFSNSSTLAILNQSQTKDIPYLIPAKEEQNNIVNYINTETNKIDNTISKIQKEIELLQEYQTAIVTEAVTGKIDVREK